MQLEVASLKDRAARWLAPRAGAAPSRADSPIACLQLDRDGVLQHVNRAACELLGYREAQMAGYPLWRFLLEEDGAIARMGWLRRLQDGSPGAPFESTFRRQNGSLARVEVREERTFDDEGAVSGLRAWLIDVSGCRERERALERRLDEMNRSHQAMQQFALAAAHDLNQPLRMAAAYVSLASKRANGRNDAEGLDLLNLAEEACHRMQGLVTGLLDWSLAGAGDAFGPPRPALAALEDALANLRLLLEEHGALVRYSPMPELPVHPARLTQVFQNLIANAVQFRSDLPPVVDVSCEETATEWRFSVSDNGEGIDPRDASRIFEPLVRLNPCPAKPGCGLGLAIARRSVEAMGGRIWALARPTPGAVIYFTVRKPEASRNV